MFNLDLSYAWLHWTRAAAPEPPSNLQQIHVQTPDGPLELLSNGVDSSSPPILFVHGGMGAASVWTEYMGYLREQGIAAYAVSLRGHGGSWSPSFLRMVFFTPRRVLGDDLVTAADWVREKHGDVVLVGHSAGGGLLQDVLARGRVKGLGLGLLGAIPGYGSLTVNANWLALDPWFNLRLVLQGLHPNSPVSCPQLTKRAFFSDAMPLSAVIPFQTRMCRFESYQWAFSMLFSFAKARDVLAGLTGTQPGRLLVMAGEEDKLMTASVTRETVAWYRTAGEETAHLEIVPGGHHLQNDVEWRVGAERLVHWYRGLHV